MAGAECPSPSVRVHSFTGPVAGHFGDPTRGGRKEIAVGASPDRPVRARFRGWRRLRVRGGCGQHAQQRDDMGETEEFGA